MNEMDHEITDNFFHTLHKLICNISEVNQNNAEKGFKLENENDFNQARLVHAAGVKTRTCFKNIAMGADFCVCERKFNRYESISQELFEEVKQVAMRVESQQKELATLQKINRDKDIVLEAKEICHIYRQHLRNMVLSEKNVQSSQRDKEMRDLDNKVKSARRTVADLQKKLEAMRNKLENSTPFRTYISAAKRNYILGSLNISTKKLRASFISLRMAMLRNNARKSAKNCALVRELQ